MPTTERAVCRHIILVALAALVACDSAAVDPVYTAGATILRATSRLEQVGTAYADVTDRPTVIVSDASGRPVSGAAVRFVTSGALGDSGSVILRTDTSGRAQLGKWSLRVASTYTTVASTGTLPPVTFRTFAVPATLRDSALARRCPMSDSLRQPLRALDSTLARLRTGRPLSIVAFGSSSTYGLGATQPGLGYVERIAGMLAAAFPRSSITVRNAGVIGITAPDMAASLESAVLASGPQLVVLQTGTIEALRDLPIDSLRLPVTRMLQRLRERGVEVVLLDSQRFRGFGGSDVYRAYQQTLADAGATFGVSTVRRFKWYDEMLDSQTYTYDDLLSSDYLHPTDLGHECTAHLFVSGVVATLLGRALP